MANDCTLSPGGPGVPLVILADIDADTGVKTFLADSSNIYIHKGARPPAEIQFRFVFTTHATALTAALYIYNAPGRILLASTLAGTVLRTIATQWPAGFLPLSVQLRQVGTLWAVDTRMVS